MISAPEARRPRMLILMFTRLDKEPRAYKQIAHFSQKYEVTTAGYGRPLIDGVRHIELPVSSELSVLRRKALYALQTICFKLGLYGLAYRFVALHRWLYAVLSREPWDVIIAHDVNTIPLANRLRPKYGVLADMHEYAPRQYEHSAEWVRVTAPYYRWICAHELTKARVVTTVSQGIVDEYKAQFGVDPVLVVNATPSADLPVGEVSEPIKLVHSGIAAPARKLEIMIDAVLATSKNVTLDLYLVNSAEPSYLDALKARAQGSSRVRFPDPVPYIDLVNTLNKFDVGLSIIAASTFNHEYCLPNKFFDYVQARLGHLVGPSPEMARIVGEFQMGRVLGDFEAETLTAALNDLDIGVVRRWKQQADVAAASLTGESQVAIWDRLVRDMCSR